MPDLDGAAALVRAHGRHPEAAREIGYWCYKLEESNGRGPENPAGMVRAMIERGTRAQGRRRGWLEKWEQDLQRIAQLDAVGQTAPTL